MQDQEILKAKLEHANFTVADKPYEFSTGITLDQDKLVGIHQTKHGMNIPVAEIIDDYDSLEDRLKRVFANQYSLDEHEKLPLNFMLIDCGIYGIKSPDPYGGMSIAGTLTEPAIHAATMPDDEISVCGQYKKMLPINSPHHFMNGKPHMFCHTLSHSNVDQMYPLLSSDSQLNCRMIFPNKKVEGTGGVLPEDCESLISYVKNKDNGVMLHSHTVCHDSMYPNYDRPTVTEVLSADARSGGTVKSQHLIALKNGTFPVTWYMSREEDKKHIKDDGVLAPIDDYAFKTFHFIDSCNESRATNFKRLGIWVDMDHMKVEKVPKVTAKMKFKILPIVPYHEEGKEHIPYQNFIRHIKRELQQVDKPFC